MAILSKSIAALALGSVVVQAQLWDKVVQTSLGPVQGYKYFNQSTLETFFNISDSNVTAYLGIPFAADTGYENRWKAPQPREPWNETLHATEWGHACPSNDNEDISEDCLNLNLWTNAADSSANLPVMVWNQGSGETSNTAWWYGGGMALKDVILITFNRRDDAFGYLAHPELNEEGFEATGHRTSGNYGVLDQLEVLKWVQKNIRSFGGDPTRVTVAGQSFGSSQVYHAINSPLFKGYLHGGISQSGIRWPQDPMLQGLATSYVDMETALVHGKNYTAHHNASSISELRTKSMEDLLVGSQDRVDGRYIDWITALSAGYPLIFKPVLDDYVLPAKYIDTLLRTGPASDVPLITGNTRDESGAEPGKNYSVAQYKEYCTLKYGTNLSSEYFDLYPATPAGTQNEAWRTAARDQSSIGSWAFASTWYEKAASPFYTYYWTHAPPGQSQGAFHQSEIMYALNALYANSEDYPFTGEDFVIQDQMAGYWSNFAKTGNPNGEGLEEWRANDAGGKDAAAEKRVMELGGGFGEMGLVTVIGDGDSEGEREEEKVEFVMKWWGGLKSF